MSVKFGEFSNLALSFFMEVCALVALSYWGIHIGNTVLLKITFGILVPLLTAFVWGIFLAPKSSKRLNDWMNASLKLMVLGFSDVALGVAGLHSIAIIFGIILISNKNPNSGRWAIFEDDGISAWLYMPNPNDQKPILDCWIYNRIVAPSPSEIKKFKKSSSCIK